MTHHHPVAFALIIGAALTLLVVSVAAPRLVGIRADHAMLRCAVGMAGLMVLPFIVLTLEAFVS